MALAAGHAGWGLLAYHDALREILRARLVDTVGDGLVRKEHSRDARAAAFWFMAAAPATWLTGYLVESALRAGDRRAVSVAGRTAVSLGALGTAVIPRSGFAGLTSLGFWLLALARRMTHSTHDEPTPSRDDRVPTVLWQREAPEVIRSLDTTRVDHHRQVGLALMRHAVRAP
jgi:hypothetical protein